MLPATATTDIFRITQTAVIGLQARVALYKGEYATAETLATQVISAVALSSITEVPNVWTDDSNAGIVFALRRIPGDGRVGTLFNATNGDKFFLPSTGIVDLYDQTDDVRFAAFFSDAGGTVGKYPGPAGQQGLNNIKMTINFI